MKRTHWVALGGMVASAVIAGFVLGRSAGERGGEASRVEAMPILLRDVQAIGELRTVTFTYQNVFEFETHREPESWMNVGPVAGMVRAGTRNQALVSATGQVQAGIDLTQAELRRDGDVWILSLPAPQVYEPTVTAEVHDSRGGLFWADQNLGLKARQDAANRFRASALTDGIEDTARRNAEQELARLFAPVGSDVVVEFRG